MLTFPEQREHYNVVSTVLIETTIAPSSRSTSNKRENENFFLSFFATSSENGSERAESLKDLSIFYSRSFEIHIHGCDPSTTRYFVVRD